MHVPQHVGKPMPTPRRGRPFGFKTRVLRDDRKLGIHHFAFVRSRLFRLDLRVAHDRSLAWSFTCTDLRHIEHRYEELLTVIRSSCLQLASSLPVDHAAHRAALADLQRGPRFFTKRLPALDEWVNAEGLDRGFYGEADLLAEYNAAHGIDVDAAAAVEEAGWQEESGNIVKALNRAEQMLAARPAQTDGAALCRRVVASAISGAADHASELPQAGRTVLAVVHA